MQIRKILKKILTNSNILFNSLNEVYVNEDYIKISLDKKTSERMEVIIVKSKLNLISCNILL